MEPLLVISNALQEIVVMNIEFEKICPGRKIYCRSRSTRLYHFVWIVFKIVIFGKNNMSAYVTGPLH